jgi:hypothetical protein
MGWGEINRLDPVFEILTIHMLDRDPPERIPGLGADADE